MATRRDKRLLGASVPGEARARGDAAGRRASGAGDEKLWPLGRFSRASSLFLENPGDLQALPDAAHSLEATLQGCGASVPGPRSLVRRARRAL